MKDAEDGKFRVYGMQRIEEAVEIFMGVPMGEPITRATGLTGLLNRLLRFVTFRSMSLYPKDTVLGQIERNLRVRVNTSN